MKYNLNLCETFNIYRLYGEYRFTVLTNQKERSEAITSIKGLLSRSIEQGIRDDILYFGDILEDIIKDDCYRTKRELEEQEQDKEKVALYIKKYGSK